MEGPLTKIFGKEDVTSFSGSALDRLSYLRGDTEFLHQALHAPCARFLVLRNRDILIEQSARIAWLEFSDVAEIIGDQYCVEPEAKTKDFDFKKDSPGYSFAQLVFLGVDHAVPSEFKYKQYTGAPRFAVDASTYTHAQPSLRASLTAFYAFSDSLAPHRVFEVERNHLETFDKSDLSIIAQARTVLDWIMKSRFCAGCGNHVMSVWGGYKLACPESLNERADCLSLHTVCNFAFPRTDCCVIAAVVSHDGQRVLVGRSARFPATMYSCLAGFLEGGESIEDCVRREIFEESGVKVGRVVLHGSQPWPYPANIMIGCLAEVADSSDESHGIYLAHDKELVDAKWIPMDELRVLVKELQNDTLSIPADYAIAWNLLNAVTKLT